MAETMDFREKQSSEKRLIDANALMSYMDECSKESRFRVYYGYAKSFINDAPTVDAVPVVRCRECKHWGDEDGKLQGSDGALFARCKIHNYLLDGRHTGWCPTENDFCSYGERKDGDD